MTYNCHQNKMFNNVSLYDMHADTKNQNILES